MNLSFVTPPEVEVNGDRLTIWNSTKGWEVSYPTEELSINASQWISRKLHTFDQKDRKIYLYSMPINSYDQLVGKYLETCKSAGLTVAIVSRDGKDV